MTAATPSASTIFTTVNKLKSVYDTQLFNRFDEKIILILYFYIKISLRYLINPNIGDPADKNYAILLR